MKNNRLSLKREEIISHLLFKVLIGFFVFIILLVDYLIPVGVAIGFLYVLPLIFSAFLIKEKRFIKILAFCSLLFVIFGAFFNSSEFSNPVFIINRSISIITIIVSAWISHLFIGLLIKNLNLEYFSRIALEASPNGMIMIDVTGKIILANRQIEDIFGYKKEDLFGKNVDILVPDDIRPNHPELRLGFFKNPAPRRMGIGRELFGKRKDGSMVPVEIGLTPVSTEEGNFVVSSIVDITDRKDRDRIIIKKNQELENSLLLLNKSNKELEEFAYVASHDLQAPVRHISTHLEILKDSLNIELDQKQLDSIHYILSATAKMKSLISDLLRISRIGKEKLRLMNTDLNFLVNEVVEYLAPEINDIGAEIEIEKLPTVYVDPILISLVFQNLIQNAIRYREVSRQLKVSVYFREDDEFFYICVKDNGIGFDQEHEFRIFEMFKRLNVSTGRDGTGIGLAICKKIVELHEGKIFAKSKTGEGSIFTLEIKKGKEHEYEAN